MVSTNRDRKRKENKMNFEVWWIYNHLNKINGKDPYLYNAIYT